MKIIKTISMAAITTVFCYSISLDGVSTTPSGIKEVKNETHNFVRTSTRDQVGKNKAKLSDDQLTAKVKEALQNGDKNYNEEITFEVKEGKVTLHGAVDSITDLELIQERISKLGDWIVLEDNIEIRPEEKPTARWHQRDPKSQKPKTY